MIECIFELAKCIKTLMSEPLFSVISWVNNQELYQDMVKSFDHVDCEFLEMGQEYESMAQAYNAGTEKARGKYLVYCHQDARLIDPDFTSKIVRTLTMHPNIGLLGVAGTINNNQRSVWFQEAASAYLGGIQEHGEWLRFGQTDCMARTIDAVFMVTDKCLMFPEMLPGIHMLDAWMCRQTEDLGYYNWVCDVKVHHLSPGNPYTQSFRDNLSMYRWYWYQNKNNNGDTLIEKSKFLPELSIVIAVYNNIFCTKNLLQQLKVEAPGAEIIIVNNASTDGTRQWLNSQKDVTVIDNSKNEGVSRAWNAGLNRAKGKVLAVLNNDVELFPGGIQKLYAAAVKHGLACANMIKCNSDFLGGTVTNHVANSDYANGEALFFRRDVWLNIGEFDESYELAYYEDTDWSCRARLKGYTWHGVPGTMRHLHGQTSKLIPNIDKYIIGNQKLFIERYAHLGFGSHIALHFNGPIHNAINALSQIRSMRKNMPLARIYVYCSPEHNVLFEIPEVDYVGLPDDEIESNQNVVLQYSSTSSGIAITTRNRPEMLDACLLHFKTYSNENQLKHLVIYDDASDRALRLKNQAIVKKYGLEECYYYGEEQVGIAQAKNSCLYLLGESHSYYFLFDDDTFPIEHGWMELYINAHQQSGYQHLLYGNNVHNTISERANGIECYNSAYGVLLFFTKAMYETLGGLCTDYGFYGGEHVDYTLRAQKVGMTNKEKPFAGPINCAQYIWNYDTRTNYQKTLIPIQPIHHEDSISREKKDEFLQISLKHEDSISDNRPIRYPIKIQHKITKIT